MWDAITNILAAGCCTYKTKWHSCKQWILHVQQSFLHAVCWTKTVPHLKLSENRCGVIGDKQLLQVIDDHFVHTWRASESEFIHYRISCLGNTSVKRSKHKDKYILLLEGSAYHLAHRQYVWSEKAPCRLWCYETLPLQALNSAATVNNMTNQLLELF